MDKKTLLNELKTKNKALRVAEIEGLLYIVTGSKKGLHYNDIISLTGLPKETITVFKDSISNYLDAKFDGLLVNQDYSSTFESLLFKPYSWSLIELEDLNLEQNFNQVREFLNVPPKREYDQFWATNKTSVSKALLCEKLGFTSNTKIAFIGDDDLVSLILENLLDDSSKISVFDIDADLLTEIASKSKRNIQTIQHDCRTEVPSLYKDQFDVVITDPPYTANGVKIFLNRALELLGKADVNDNKYIVLYYGNSFKSPEKTLKIQEIISEMGLLLENKLDKFARYNGAESIGNASSAYVLKLTPFSRKLDAADDSSVYTHEIQKEEKFPYVDHFTFKLYGVDEKLLRSRNLLLKAISRFCDTHRLRVVDRVITEFKGGGLTITLVLSSSNCTIHTWPELNALHIDLITCTPIYNKDNFRISLQKTLEPRSLEIRKIE